MLGNLVGGASSIIQFDDFSSMVVLVSAYWVGEGLNRGTMDTASTSAWKKASPLVLTPNTQHLPLSP